MAKICKISIASNVLTDCCNGMLATYIAPFHIPCPNFEFDGDTVQTVFDYGKIFLFGGRCCSELEKNFCHRIRLPKLTNLRLNI